MSRHRRSSVAESYRRSLRRGEAYHRVVAHDARPDRGPLSDFWYSPIGMSSSAGTTVTPDTALTLSAVYRAVRVISDDVATLPLHLYRRLPERAGGLPGGKERVTSPLADVLGKRPNPRQTALQWRQMMTALALLRGNGYSRIHPGPRGAVDRLEPLRSDRVRPELLDTGRVLYLYRNREGREERLTQDEMFHLPGFSIDPESPCGVSVITYARTSLGLSIATEEFGARQFGQTPRPAFAITSPHKIEADRRKEIGASFRAAFSAPAGWGGVPVMDGGMTVAAIGMSHDDAQYLETRAFQIRDVSRWFGVPAHRLSDLGRATWANIEQENISYVAHSLMFWLESWEQTIARDLVGEDEGIFAEHVVEGLLRGDAAARGAYYQAMTNIGALTPNEVRSRENLNPVPWGDEPVARQGAAPAAGPPSPPPPARPAPDDDEDEEDEAFARLRARGVRLNGSARHG